MRSLTRTVVLALSSALVLMIAASPASAAPSPSGARLQLAPVAVAAPAALDPKALEHVPAPVVRLMPGSPEFLDRYFGTTRSAFDPEGFGVANADFTGAQCSTRGGDVGLYAVDFVRRFGDVMQYASDATGETADYPTSPWPGSGWTESPNMPFPAGYDNGAGSLVHLPNPKLLTACGADLAPFGQVSAESPWGFDFFNEPDQGSVNAFLGELSATPAQTGVLSGDQSWIATNNTWEGTDFPPTDFMNYCTDALNPLCMTAMFLHCPDSGDGAAQCQEFNVNTMKLNIALASWVVGNNDPQFNVWSKVLRAGRTLVTTFTVLAVVAGVLTVAVTCVYLCAAAASALPVVIAVGRAVLATGALKKIALVLAGLALAAGSAGGVLGVIDCAASFGKCFAQWSGDGMIGALDQIPAAIQSSSVPDLNSTAWSNLFNGIAGVATVLLIILFLIAVVLALLKGKPGEILPSIGGLIGFGVAVGLGGVLVTAMIVGRDAVTTALSGADGPSAGSVGDVATLLAGRQTVALKDLIDGDATVGLFGIGVLAFIGMLMALVINMIVWLSNQWVALAIAIMLLQAAGMAGTAGPRKWVIRGLSALWALLLAKPLMMLTFRVGDAMIATSTGFTSLMGGVIVLLSTVVVFAALPKLFSIGDGTPLGVGATLKSGFDQALAYRARGGSGGRGGGASMSEAESRSARNRGTDGATGSGPAGGGPSGGGPNGGGPISPLKQANGGNRFDKAPAASGAGAIGSAGSENAQSDGQGESARELVGAGVGGSGSGSGGQGLSDRPGPVAATGDVSAEPRRGNGMQAMAARLGEDGGRHSSGSVSGNNGAAPGGRNGGAAAGSTGAASPATGSSSGSSSASGGPAGGGSEQPGRNAGASPHDGGGASSGSGGAASGPGPGPGPGPAPVGGSAGGVGSAFDAPPGGGAAGPASSGAGSSPAGGSAPTNQSSGAPASGNSSPSTRGNSGAQPRIDGRDAPGTSGAPWAASRPGTPGRPGSSGRPAPRPFGPASGSGSWANNNRRGK